jgi:uncharacterized protein YbjT (DUF2867 family)
MKIILTGATGMVGEGVLIECLENNAVSEVLMVNRRPFDLKHSKLKELLVPDFTKLESVEPQLKGYDGCFFCAGISSVGMNEEKYTHITYTTTLSFASTLARLNPGMVFTYVSGASTDSSEKGKMMWARVKGKTENDLMKLPFKGEYNFRPGVMKHFPEQKNVKSFFKPMIAILALLIPKKVLTLKQVGQAMINAVAKGYSKKVLEIADIQELAK